MFGEDAGEDKVNFHWTAQEDYEKRGLKKQIKLQEIKLAGANTPGLTGIQLIFTDGIQSPVILANRNNALVSHKIDTRKTVNVLETRTYYSYLD